MERSSGNRSEGPAISRREFIQRTSRTAVGAAAALALGSDAVQAATGEPQYRVLGRTGLKVTTISFGGIQIQDRPVLDWVIDHGINLVHTSSSYTNGKSWVAFGEVMKAKRDKVVLAVKAKPHEVDEALKVLQTDHIDILIPDHGINAAPFPTDELRAEYEAAKKAGKIRFTGFATHKSEASIIAAATESGFFDVMLVNFNAGNRKALEPVIAEARKKHNMGFMAMKTSRGLKGAAPEVFAAGLKDLMASPVVDTLLVGMGSYQEAQKNIALMSQQMTRREKEMLNAHLGVTLASLCTFCGKCEVCPRGVAVADVMRCEAYMERGDARLARDVYVSLPSGTSVASCDDCGLCTRACPKRLNVAGRIQAVHAAVA